VFYLLSLSHPFADNVTLTFMLLFQGEQSSLSGTKRMESTPISNVKKFFIVSLALNVILLAMLSSDTFSSWKYQISDIVPNSIRQISKPIVTAFVNITQTNNREISKPILPANADISKTKNLTFTDNIKKHVIVLFNPVDWFNVEMFNPTLSNNCSYRNCRLTSDRTNLRNQSAIIYLLTAAPTLPEKPPLSPTERNPDQAWIFAWLESPVHHTGGRTRYQSAPWRDTVNWTMEYTYDADLFLPYGRLEKRTTPVEKDYRAIFLRKTKMVAWVASNCHTSSKRELYVQELKKYNISVDIYGHCGGKWVDRNDVRKVINNDYKFYLSFENSFCKDYITEKFFSYFQLDVVVVTRGGGNYSRILSNDSFINTADFKTVKDLAMHLSTVGANEERYIDYLRNKDKFDASDQIGARFESMCDLCDKINNLDSNRKVYTDLVNKVTKGTCFTPNDIV